MTEIKSVTVHCHDGDHFAIAASKVRAEIKSSAQANRGKPGQIVADKLFHHPKEVSIKVNQYMSTKLT